MSADRGRLLDNLLAERIAGDPNLAIPWYLMASYLYYIRATSILTDCAYDQLCVFLNENWDDIDHRHKDIIDRADLSCGTGYTIPEAVYPSIAKSSAGSLAKEHGIELTV